jgi:hypothetical protein
MLSTTAASVSLMTAADRCDRCGAAAKVLAILNKGGELLFCNHHARLHRPVLDRIAIWIEDRVLP